MNNYTPGPWHHFTAQVHDNNRNVIARLPIGKGCAPLAERAGNAMLIAAAPDLLEALKNTLQYIPACPELGNALDAINKAEGRE